jgi:hypothetical protein
VFALRHVSIGIVSFLLVLPGFLLLAGGVAAGVAMESMSPAVAGVATFVLYLIGLSIFTSALQQVIIAGVYMYAAEGQVPAGFSEESLQSAFQPKE